MTKKATAAPKSQSQKDKFMAMAKELGEASETAFNKVLKRVGKTTLAKPKKAIKK
jgi:hypothetical protein